jgi:hypothetical protein
MSTSGSVDFASTRSQVIYDALSLIGVYGVGRTISDSDMQLAARTLNRMIKQWQAENIHLWQRKEAYLFLDKSVADYTLGSSAYMCDRSDAVITTIGAAEAAAQTSITVTSSSGMAISDYCVIELDSGAAHQTTISNVTDSTTIVIADALPSDAAAGNSVFTFTNKVNKPLKVISARRKTEVGTDSSAIPLKELTQDEYVRLPNRMTDGTPTQFYYNPNVSDGNLSLYLRPDSAGTYLEITYQRLLEDMDADANTFDFPVEWEECIVYQLAYRLAPHFGVDKNILQPEASVLLDKLSTWDHEPHAVQIQPELK